MPRRKSENPTKSDPCFTSECNAEQSSQECLIHVSFADRHEDNFLFIVLEASGLESILYQLGLKELWFNVPGNNRRVRQGEGRG